MKMLSQRFYFYFLIFFVVLIFGLFFFKFQELNKEIEAIVSTQISVPKTDTCRQFNEFKTIMAGRDMKNYKNPGNNCYDQSKAVQEQLKASGIASSLMIGKDRAHAWLGIWVDATDGSFVAPGRYSVMEVRQTPTHVICSNE